jgi:hypothetical protein
MGSLHRRARAELVNYSTGAWPSRRPLAQRTRTRFDSPASWTTRSPARATSPG